MKSYKDKKSYKRYRVWIGIMLSIILLKDIRKLRLVHYKAVFFQSSVVIVFFHTALGSLTVCVIQNISNN